MLNPIAHERREQYLRWLLELTRIPTAAGREWRVVEWIEKWVAERGLAITRDRAGNLTVAPAKPWGCGGAGGPGPVFITAHLDHPAFVVERIVAPGVVELTFRGGVMDAYFEAAGIVIHAGGREGRAERAIDATITGVAGAEGALGKSYLAEMEDGVAGNEVRVGDVANWDLPAPEIDAQGLVHTHACDDLAAAAAALSAMDALAAMAERGERVEDVRLLFTRAEEIGFTGAIAACKLGTMPRGSRVVALENSRSFADSPIGGGPIVRVGDRLTVFDPNLTAACAKRAEEISGHAATPRAIERAGEPGWKWQRKLMAGGACEATVFCAFGYAATCLCLPLGNYHNMADLAAVQDGSYDRARLGPPRVGREFIHREDYLGLVDLLIAIGQSLPEGNPALPRIESLYATKAFVLDEV